MFGGRRTVDGSRRTARIGVSDNQLVRGMVGFVFWQTCLNGGML